MVPRELLEVSMDQVPKSVATLSPLVDFAVDIHNYGGADVDLVTPGMNWKSFTTMWSRATCQP